ncbi:hypothetical protein F7725_001310 [Dissostichus mawsoni]|uniref:SAM domain-containing protein n=1 Tax=Dissostichus mawsoni TaxID=36200 RepID=A0A7J5ZGY7_DISMA|nr:hypothetical protein F7725_001310 [Dissostichus mawsoni]
MVPRPTCPSRSYRNRFSPFCRLFTNFSGADLLKLTREDVIQICGPADGIRLFNALKGRISRYLPGGAHFLGADGEDRSALQHLATTNKSDLQTGTHRHPRAGQRRGN